MPPPQLRRLRTAFTAPAPIRRPSSPITTILALLLALNALLGCGEDKCAGVRCSPGRVCQPGSGACAVPDAGL